MSVLPTQKYEGQHHSQSYFLDISVSQKEHFTLHRDNVVKMPYTTAPMEKLTHRSLITTPYNLTYSYYLSPNFSQKLSKDVPTLMFLHGYPDDAYMWAGAVPTFLELPYPFIVLDILGFGGSSKPTDASKYNYRNQANSIAQILDQEKVPNNVIPIGESDSIVLSIRVGIANHIFCRPRLGFSHLPTLLSVPSAPLHRSHPPLARLPGSFLGPLRPRRAEPSHSQTLRLPPMGVLELLHGTRRPQSHA